MAGTASISFFLSKTHALVETRRRQMRTQRRCPAAAAPSHPHPPSLAPHLSSQPSTPPPRLTRPRPLRRLCVELDADLIHSIAPVDGRIA
jgi:hypothetical protein